MITLSTNRFSFQCRIFSSEMSDLPEFKNEVPGLIYLESAKTGVCVPFFFRGAVLDIEGDVAYWTWESTRAGGHRLFIKIYND